MGVEEGGRRPIKIRLLAIGSFCFLLLGHFFTMMGFIRLIEAALWGLKNKGTFWQSFMSTLASDILQSETLPDGTIIFKRIGPGPTSELIMLIILPMICYFIWYFLRKRRKRMEITWMG
jgi:hypothetical protein